mgnify:CR=1 FL=1
MSETQIASDQIIEEGNQNKNLENQTNSLNDQDNNNIDKNLNSDTPANEGAEKEKKISYFMLTPLESFLLNKMMPRGFKFETEENSLKSLETPKNQVKRYKQINKHIDNSYKSNSRSKNINYECRNRGVAQKRRAYQGFNNLDISINASNVSSKCKLGLERIKNSTWINRFYYPSNPEAPCISKIEQKVNKNEYLSFYEFEMDLRKVWNYFFNLGQKSDNDLYEKTSKMSEKWEQICSDLENTNDNIYNYSSVKKRADLFYRSNDNKKYMNSINNLINKENTQSETDNSLSNKKKLNFKSEDFPIHNDKRNFI